MSRILVVGGGAGLNAALLSCLMAAGISDNVDIVTEHDLVADDSVFRIVNTFASPVCDIDVDFPAHPQVTYSGPLRRGKKGKIKRW